MTSVTPALGPIFPASLPRISPGKISPDEMMGRHSLYYPLGAPIASLTAILEAANASELAENAREKPEPTRPPPIATVQERGAKVDIST